MPSWKKWENTRHIITKIKPKNSFLRTRKRSVFFRWSKKTELQLKLLLEELRVKPLQHWYKHTCQKKTINNLWKLVKVLAAKWLIPQRTVFWQITSAKALSRSKPIPKERSILEHGYLSLLHPALPCQKSRNNVFEVVGKHLWKHTDFGEN